MKLQNKNICRLISLIIKGWIAVGKFLNRVFNPDVFVSLFIIWNERMKDVWWWIVIFDTDPWLKMSPPCNVNSSASVPAKSSNIALGVSSPMAVSSSPNNSKLFQSFSMANDGIGLSLPMELAFELARWRKSGDNWKFPLFSFKQNHFRDDNKIKMAYHKIEKKRGET